MKRILTISLALLFGLSLYAQIQNKPLGLTLGSTTKNQVINHCQNNNQKIVGNYDDRIIATSAKFAGYDWTCFTFYFHNNKLCSVDMCIVSPHNAMWNNLKESLNKKYRSYYISKISNANRIVYSDGNTAIFLEYSPRDGQVSPSINLRYTDEYLLNQKFSDAEKEL